MQDRSAGRGAVQIGWLDLDTSQCCLICARSLATFWGDEWGTEREGNDMDTIQNGYRGLHLLWNLNWDRLLYLSTIAVALLAGAWLGSLY